MTTDLADSGVPQPGQEPAFLRDPALDQLLDAVLALTAELWIERDRRIILEQLLTAEGVLKPAAVELHRSDAALQAQRDAARESLVRRVIGGFAGRTEAGASMTGGSEK